MSRQDQSRNTGDKNKLVRLNARSIGIPEPPPPSMQSAGHGAGPFSPVSNPEAEEMGVSRSPSVEIIKVTREEEGFFDLVSPEGSPVPAREVPRESSPMPAPRISRGVSKEPSPELLPPYASHEGSPADYGEMEVVTDDDQPPKMDAVQGSSVLDALLDYYSEGSNASPAPSRTGSAAFPAPSRTGSAAFPAPSRTVSADSSAPPRAASTESDDPKEAAVSADLIFRQASRCLSMAARNVPAPTAIVAEEAGEDGAAVEAVEDEPEVDWNLPNNSIQLAMILEAIIQEILEKNKLFPKAKACLTKITELISKRSRGVSVKFASALRDMVVTIKNAEAQRPDIAAWWQDEVKNLAAIMEKKARHLTGTKSAKKDAGSDPKQAKKSKKDPSVPKLAKKRPATAAPKVAGSDPKQAKTSKKPQPEPQIMVRMFSHGDQDSDDEVTSLQFDIMDEAGDVNKLLPVFDMEQREALLACKFESFPVLKTMLSKEKLAKKIERVVGMLACLSKFDEYEPKEIEIEIPNAGEDFIAWIRMLYTVDKVIYEKKIMTFLMSLYYFGPSLEAYDLIFKAIFVVIMSYMTKEDFSVPIPADLLASRMKQYAQKVASDFAWLFFIFANDYKVNVDTSEGKETTPEELKIIVQAFESPIGLRRACGFDDMAEDQTFIVNPSAMVSNLAEYKAQLA